MQNKEPEKLIKRHQELTHSDAMKVLSHVQRKSGEWMINTIMTEGCDAPFRYKRKKTYRDLTGQRVNLTYYPSSEDVAGFEMEIMNVVRIKVS
ncbi:MAG: hypothetical protein AB8B92_10860 [Gammaproteobacteria bacterium]